MKNLLILHGALGSKEQFLPLEALLKKEYHVHLLNFSGHGGQPFQKEFSIAQFASEVIHFLDEKQLKTIDIFGYSMGGFVALYIAKNHPERVKKIMTLGTKFLWDPEIAIKEAKMLNTDKIEEKIPAFAKVLQNRHLPNNWKDVLSRTAFMMRCMGEENPLSLSDYSIIHHSVKIGLADQDEMVTKEETMEVVNALPNALFYSLKDAKHPIEKANHDQLYSEITTFFNEL